MARTDDAAEGSAAAAGEVGGAVQAEAEGVALRIERFDPADSTLAMVLNQVAHTLEQPSSKLRLSPSTVDLAMGHDHVIAPESLQYVRDLGAGAFATVEVHRYRPPGSQGEASWSPPPPHFPQGSTRLTFGCTWGRRSFWLPYCSLRCHSSNVARFAVLFQP